VVRPRDAEPRYSGVVERSAAVTYVDASAAYGVRMSFLSPEVESLRGYPASTFLDEPDTWFDVVHPDDQERVDAAARRAGSEGAPFDEEYRMRHADGRWIWVHDTSTPMSGHDGEDTTYYQGFLVEISARKEAE